VGIHGIGDRHCRILCPGYSPYVWWDKGAVRGIDIDMSAPIVMHDIFTPQIRVRVSFKSPKIRDDFNAGLKVIKENGDYKAIFLRYDHAIDAMK
jgi:hypothetical protein